MFRAVQSTSELVRQQGAWYAAVNTYSILPLVILTESASVRACRHLELLLLCLQLDGVLLSRFRLGLAGLSGNSVFELNAARTNHALFQ